MGVIKTAEIEIDHIVTALESEGHALSGRLRAAWDALKADAPVLEHDAATDAADVVHTAETQGINAAEAEAAVDAGKLAAEGAHDAAKAAEAPAEPAA
jgi:hypothetical protein